MQDNRISKNFKIDKDVNRVGERMKDVICDEVPQKAHEGLKKIRRLKV